METLTPRQKRFVEEYLVDLNATQAAARAGYSPKGAEVRGSELLRNRKVAEEIRTAKAARAQRTQVTAERVLAELAAVAFSDIRDIDFGPDGKLRASSPEAARAVAAFSWSRHGRAKGGYIQYSVRLWDKVWALELCMRHLGIDRVTVNLEAFLALLPRGLADEVRRCIACSRFECDADPGVAAGSLADR
jgi:phage terminase small subunit